MAREYNISKAAGACGTCGRELQPGEEYIARLKEEGEEFHRYDFCPGCWPGDVQPADAGDIGVWRSRVPQPQEKKKLFVDNELLINFFQRLEGAQEYNKINFRYVLALVLMRKKLLVYDAGEKLPDGSEIWTMHIKGDTTPLKVVDPHMDEQKIAEISGQLGEILQGDL